jgi:predicted cupin superfamily sugar epimerase
VPRVELGERMQWIVEGGKYKSSFLLPDEPEGDKSSGLLISEVSFVYRSTYLETITANKYQVVVPGFEFTDHDFLPRKKMEDLLTAEQVRELDWMLRTEK